MTANFAKLPNLCYNAEPMTHAVLNVGDWPLTSFSGKAMSGLGATADIGRRYRLDGSVALTQQRHCPAFYVAARSESQLYQNICLSRYDAVSSAAGGWPVNGAPPFSLPDAGGSTAVRLSAPGAVRHDVAHQVAHVVLQISDDVLDDVSDRDHAHDLARVQHW